MRPAFWRQINKALRGWIRRLKEQDVRLDRGGPWTKPPGPSVSSAQWDYKPKAVRNGEVRRPS